MFDIGFWELVLIAVVGLLVLGPERLPGAIRTGSLWLNRLRRSFADIKRDIEREIGADELKRDLHNQRIMDSLREAREHLAGEVDETRRELDALRRPAPGSAETSGPAQEASPPAEGTEPSRYLPPADLPYDISGLAKPRQPTDTADDPHRP